ncbi:MAG: MaoC/PaaZ C-terminal domain-containing protein [Thermoleophilaceae bacterium]
MATEMLESPPGLGGLYARAVAGALRRGGEALPDGELGLDGVETRRDHVVAYSRACGFRLRDELPPTYPHVICFPLAMKLMTQSSFPFSVMGLVHVANRIEQPRPIGTGERLDVRVRAADLRPHDRGTQFDVLAEALVDGDPVWRSASTYLRKRGGGSASGKERPKPPRRNAIWRVPGDTGRRYAEVSGDRNPIHLHRLTALPFGMGRPIAHGMWLKARCLAALEGTLPESFEVDVAFKLPLQLPGAVSFASWPEGEGRGFAVHDRRNERPHLAGAMRARSAEP